MKPSRVAWMKVLVILCIGSFMSMYSGRSLAVNCSTGSTTVAFGNVDVVPSSTNYASTYSATSANIPVTCGNSLFDLVGNYKVSVCVNISGGSLSSRQMSGTPSTNKLNYNLYADSAHTTIWGAYPGSPTAVAVPSNFAYTNIAIFGGSSGPNNVPVYGFLQASANSSAIAGAYTDASLTATLSWNYTYSAIFSPGTPDSCTLGPSNSGFAGGSGSSSAFSLTATATVTNDCAVSATTINFGGAVGVLTSPVTNTGTITANCTNTATYTIALDKGTSTSGSIADRRMQAAGGSQVHYELYTTSGYATIWGDGTGGSSTAGGTGAGSSQSYTVYGRIPAQTSPAPGSYSDTITVTVTY